MNVADPERKMTILVVDDDEGSVLLAATVLGKRGYVVRTACDGWGALQQVAREQPDCILLDVQMPEVSGIEVLSILKNDPSTASIPVVLVTAGSGDADAHTDYRDADYYIPKPCSAEQLLHGIRRVTGPAIGVPSGAIV